MQTARTVPAGHVQIAASVQGTPGVGMPGDVFRLAEEIDALDDANRAPTPAQLDDFVTRAAAALAAPPSVDASLSLAYGVTRRFELDARIGPAGAAAGFRVQLLRRAPGIYLALGAMAGAQYASPDISRFTSEVAIQRSRRFDLSVPLSFGYSGRYVHVWGGPKYVFTRLSADLDLCIDSRRGECQDQVGVSASGRASTIAGQLGLAVGKGRVWIGVELTVARAFVRGSADYDRRGRERTTDVNQSGRVFSPAIGLLSWF